MTRSLREFSLQAFCDPLDRIISREMANARNYVSAMYFSSWSVYEAKHYINHLPFKYLTHVFYGYVVIDPDTGNCIHADPWADHYLPMPYDMSGSMNLLNVMKSKQRNFKTILSVGGYRTEEEFRRISVSREMLTNFVKSTAEFVRKYNFDGVDINWGYPQTRYESLALVRLICELRAELSPFISPLILTAVLPATEKLISDFSVAQLNKHCTFMNVKCFDFCDSDSSEHTGFHSNLYGNNGSNNENVDHVISTYVSMGASPEKLVLGMPMYGQRFDSPETPNIGSRFSKECHTESRVKFCEINRIFEFYDDVRVAAYSFDIVQNCLITYDSPKCIVEKTKYIKEKGLAGGFFWDSKSDAPQYELFQAFVNTLSNDIKYNAPWV